MLDFIFCCYKTDKTSIFANQENNLWIMIYSTYGFFFKFIMFLKINSELISPKENWIILQSILNIKKILFTSKKKKR